MIGTVNQCPSVFPEIMRFQGLQPRQVLRPNCRVLLDIPDRGTRVAARSQHGMGNNATGGVGQACPMPDLEPVDFESESTSVNAAGVTALSWFYAFGVAMVAALACGIAYVGFGPVPWGRQDDMVALTIDAAASHASADRKAVAAAGGRASDSWRVDSGEVGPLQAVNPSESPHPGHGSPKAAVPAPVPASLADVVQAISPSVATIFRKESDGEGLGSGFVVVRRDWLVTNHYLMDGVARAIAMQRSDDSEEAMLRNIKGGGACDLRSEFVILALESDWPRQPLFFNGQKIWEGTEVFAVGSPHGLAGTITRGIVSAVRTAGELARPDLASSTGIIQTDAFFAEGSSAGPLCDQKGTVIGVTTFGIKLSQSEDQPNQGDFRFVIAAEALG